MPAAPDLSQHVQEKRGAGALWAVLAHFWPYARPYWAQLVLVVFLLLAAAILELAPPWLIRYAVDNLVRESRGEVLFQVALALLGLALLQGATEFWARYLAEYVGQSVVFNLRNSLYEHLNRLSFSFYDRARTGELMSRVTEDAAVLNRFFGFAVSRIISNILVILGIAAVLLFWNYRLGLAYLALTPALFHGIAAYAGRVRPLFGRIHRQLANLTATLEETFRGIYLVKLLHNERVEAAKFDRENRRYLENSLEALQVSAFWMPYVYFLTGLAGALALWLGGREVIMGRTSPGTLVAFLTYTQMLTRPIRQTGMMMGIAARAAVAGQRILEVLYLEPEIKDAPGAYPLPPVRGRVCYENVGFTYDRKNWVLRDINLTVEPGEMVAVVGPSGAGKTTLLHLLPRFYDPTEGRITIDGHDLRQVTVESLRRQVGIVLQSTFLFNASIRENIAYGHPRATTKEIVRAAELAQIHNFIMSLPMGYDTPVGNRGVALSGGQRQRLAIARVLLTNPRLLILDEATSELDPEAEARLRAALAAVVRGRTTFIIAHRLWTVEQADRIIVIDNGRITEMGTHEELMKAGGYYAKAYQKGLGFGGE